MQTVLVAGGAGFIGSHLCKALLERDYAVIAVDNLLTSSQKNIQGLKNNPYFTFIQEDICTNSFLQCALQKIDYIFHLASPASPNQKSKRSYLAFPIETMLVNSIGTRNLLELAKQNNAKFLYTSSSEIYGDPLVSPQPESYFGNVNPNGIRSVYDEGKRFGEAMTMAYMRKHNVNVRIIRIFNTYGTQMQPDDGRVVSNFIMQALHNQPMTIYGKGEQTRSFCFVEDMVKGIMLALLSDATKGQVFNLGNPDERKVKDLATLIKQMTNSQSEIVFEDLPEDDPKARKPDITKATKILGWSPMVQLEEGLSKAITYFKSV